MFGLVLELRQGNSLEGDRRWVTDAPARTFSESGHGRSIGQPPGTSRSWTAYPKIAGIGERFKQRPLSADPKARVLVGPMG